MRIFLLIAVFLTSSPTWAQEDVGEVGDIRQGKMLIAKSDGWVRMRTHAEKAADGRISFGKESVCETHYITEKVHFITFENVDRSREFRWPQFMIKSVNFSKQHPQRIVYKMSVYNTHWIEGGVATGPNQWIPYEKSLYIDPLSDGDYMMIKVLGVNEEISVENETIIIPLQGYHRVLYGTFAHDC